MQKLIDIDETDVPKRMLFAFVKDPHTERVAQRLPLNWQEVTAEKAAHQMSVYSPKYLLYNQCHADYDGTKLAKMIDATFYIFSDGTGFAMHYDYWPTQKVTWYSFGCIHDYQRLPDGEYKVWGPHSRCTHCGDLYTAPDSSG